MAIISLNTGTQSHFTAQGSDVEGSIILDRLSDVTVVNVQDNQVLKYDASQSQWVNVATGAITALDQLSDVTITGVVDNQVLKYDAATSQWVNATDSVTVTSINDILDVNITSVQNAQSLQYNTATSKWINADITATSIDGGTY